LVGWSSSVQADSLTLYEVSSSDASGLVVCKTIEVNSNFTWAVMYQEHVVSSQCILLQKFPSWWYHRLMIAPISPATPIIFSEEKDEYLHHMHHETRGD